MTTVLVLSTVATWAMVGLIWTMQVVHYPMLASHSALAPATAAQEHQRRITPVVGPNGSAGITSFGMPAQTIIIPVYLPSLVSSRPAAQHLATRQKPTAGKNSPR